MLTIDQIQIRDPYVLPVIEEGNYYLYGSTDKNIWGKGTGFEAYVSTDLISWEGPFTVFRPSVDFFADTNFWAPEVYSYRGSYYMFATFRRLDNGFLGTAVLMADSTLGPFEPLSDGPVTPASWSSLDGSLYIDAEGQPWMVFCHEWQQVADGEICAVRLSGDLKEAVSEPVLLFTASQAAWTTPYVSPRFPERSNFVTDGPYLFTSKSGKLMMLWASFIDNQYALGISESESGLVTGPWIHSEQALYRNDGGHGMVFHTFEERLLLAIHTPNRTPDERAIFVELLEVDGEWSIGHP
ncbi:hypothetical protein FHS16_003045 [Paenibacillus endophyticus]|uniref:Glycoside hydrolase n=1 Tax=Paenibacillus endophyticus TaxID=1294268 RepID=A0A7W5C8B2_9BACL|nr:glycoside hydrolase family 43 protein [Paenibacillus endophyticus]MBB3152986.1 hypothetical protein [Paenibacillus endophyticus]